MKAPVRSINQIIEDQVQRWHRLRNEPKTPAATIPVITISREPGSGGRLVAQGVAEALGLDLFHQEVIHEMAKSAKVGMRLMKTLDERGLSMVEDWIEAAVNKHHLWPDEYAQVLWKVIGTIGKHGRAVLVGRGANFVLPPEKRFRVRVIAPQAFRVQMVAEKFDLPPTEARRRVIRTGSQRKAFVRKYFNADISDPTNYDMLLNTQTIGIEQAVKAICAAI